MMMENKMLIMDLIMVIILVSIGCFIGKIFMDEYDTWISFNGPAIGILVVGELFWWKIRRIIIKHNDKGD